MRRAIVLPAIGILGLTMAAGCGGHDMGASSAKAKPLDGPIVIGMAVARSGFAASYDLGPSRGAELAVADINARGGVLGHRLELKYGDTKSDRALGTTVGIDLLSHGAEVMLVTCDFDLGSPAAIAATSKNVVAVSPCAGSSQFGVPTLGPLAYSLGTMSAAGATNVAQFAYDRGYRKAYLWRDPSVTHTKETCSAFESRFGSQPQAKVVGSDTIQQKDTSFAGQIARLRKSGADVLELCSYNPGAATALRQLRAAGVDIPVTSHVGMDGDYWLKGVPNLKNFYYDAFGSLYGDDPRASVNDFFSRYKAKFGEPAVTSFALTGYATIQVIAKAIETAQTTDGAALAKAIDGLGSYETIAGPTGFGAKQHIVTGRPAVIMGVEGGRGKPVATYAGGRKTAEG
ncbi:ABC transporter substrate-binding protein [Actinomadura montaniterrae]|uniref:ABC transporter substrate-binding protein n=1 Tax=Actinomadura montaniterrae TaxID=1803903 RepID=A0A6L3VYF0_9ACTN|nr:ABC transporter substrate-binding protein [Actinomadura montaniterrae]KAB2385970.1 ABC transporter substrate-binding protein [Actinomadura montaniterrae]